MTSLKEMKLEGLKTKVLGRPTYFISKTTSTQDVLKQERQNMNHGTTILADTQTQGKGRSGRLWQTLPGHQLLASILLRPAISPKKLPLCTLAAAQAMHRVLKQMGVLDLQIKWPNDLLLEGQKYAGILAELFSGTDAPVIILGIGVNLQGLPENIPSEFIFPATTLEARGYHIERDVLLTAFLNVFESNLEALRLGQESTFLHALNQDLAFQNQTVFIQLDPAPVKGTVRNINPDGSLQLEISPGKQRAFRSGEIRRVLPA